MSGGKNGSSLSSKICIFFFFFHFFSPQIVILLFYCNLLFFFRVILKMSPTTNQQRVWHAIRIYSHFCSLNLMVHCIVYLTFCSLSLIARFWSPHMRLACYNLSFFLQICKKNNKFLVFYASLLGCIDSHRLRSHRARLWPLFGKICCPANRRVRARGFFLFFRSKIDLELDFFY